MKNIFILFLAFLSYQVIAQSDSLPDTTATYKNILILPIDTNFRLDRGRLLNSSHHYLKLENLNEDKYIFCIQDYTSFLRDFTRYSLFDRDGKYLFTTKSIHTFPNQGVFKTDSTFEIYSFLHDNIHINLRVNKLDETKVVGEEHKKLDTHVYSIVFKSKPHIAANDSVNALKWKNDYFAHISYENLDTSLNEFQIYNPEIRTDYTRIFLGNIGQPGFSKRYSNEEFTFLASHDHLLYKSENVSFYNVKSPFTNFAYTLGPNKEQTLEVFHSQNINKNWNIGAHYHNIGSEGLITQQEVKNNRFSAFSSYNSERYDAYFSFTRNKFNWLENGGIVSDSYLIDSLDLSDDVDDLNQIPIYLDNAKSLFLRKEFSFYHEFKIGKYQNYIIDTLAEELYNSKLSLAHFLKTYNYHRLYTDYEDTTDFYSSINNNSNTFDSVYYANRIHGFGIKANNILGKNYLKSGVFYHIVKEKYSYFNKDTLFVNSKDTNIYTGELAAFFDFRIKRKYTLSVDGKYSLNGYYKDNLETNLSAFRFFEDTSQIGLQLVYNIKTPNYFLANYASNHFKWQNNFSETKLWETKISIIYDKPSWFLNTKISATLIDNSIFFDSLAYPQLNDTSFFVYSAELQKKFNLWKIVILNKLLYQTSDNSSTISIPDIVLYNSTYLEEDIRFKMTNGLLSFQLGFDIYYNSEYYATGYMPALGQFYQQRSSLYGNYPQIDVFLNVKIKRMRLFLRMKHINEGYMARNYFSAMNYPLHGRGFIMGFSWGFYD